VKNNEQVEYFGLRFYGTYDVMRHITDGGGVTKGLLGRESGADGGLRFIFITSVAICHRLVS